MYLPTYPLVLCRPPSPIVPLTSLPPTSMAPPVTIEVVNEQEEHRGAPAAVFSPYNYGCE